MITALLASCGSDGGSVAGTEDLVEEISEISGEDLYDEDLYPEEISGNRTEEVLPAEDEDDIPEDNDSAAEFDLSLVPEYSDSPYSVVNGNVPYFTEDDLTTDSYEYYSPLDSLGRCGPAMASIGQDLMPTESRGSISEVKPTGWHSEMYDIVDGGYLYNRCHLIAYELTGENANEKNLITGTRYFNVTGMLPFENMVADYIKETGNHVLYRVTPVFEGDNLVAAGVLMEAMSVEDEGEDILFNVFCYNVQPGITIDYATGESSQDDVPEETGETASAKAGSAAAQGTEDENSGAEDTYYILNTNTKKFHYPDCDSVKQMSEKNKQEYTGSRDELISRGYTPCGNCKP